ncbi:MULTISPECIES: hypothetical protein [Morganellaceae]|uniref:Uncharacterized protein n=2 Tax=Morganellaceae TaxID=1903414 RepID=A0A1B8HBL1_9GAMM|nr:MULTISPECIES: hypothetical protein [Morganellaceae]ELR5071179.1 hypothetical protein [Providencia rettgeri]QCJ72313.1 hypothetical protein C9446_21195 [Providencia heimbachae]ELR5204389.1 hypothetical protein [Providencia rettgeri]OBU06432.1 hypothetical protein AYY17_20680 [Morganella psychrotolerans]UNH28914.1 hypothetical protein MNY64_16815 [Moellerella wisconsensis]
MNIETTDVELYLKRQESYLRMKFTKFMEGYIACCFYGLAIVFLAAFAVILFQYYSDKNPSEGLVEFVTVAGYLAGVFGACLIFTVLFFAGRLFRFNAMLSVDEIKRLYESMGREYDTMTYLPTDGRSAIEYLNTVIATGIPIDVTHESRAQKLLYRDTKTDDLKARTAGAESALLNASRCISVSGKMPDVNKNESISSTDSHD